MYSFGNITEAAEAAEFFDVAAKSMEEMRESLRSIDECSLDSAGQWRKNLYFCCAKLNHRMLSSPPPPILEMIASELACFTKQTNIYVQRKTIQANNFAMCIGICYIAHARAARKQADTGYHK
jgi:hypothetical protein